MPRLNVLPVALAVLGGALFPIMAPFAVEKGTVVAYALGEGEEQTQVTFTAIDDKTYVVENLPFPGVVLYRPQTDEIAYQHPEEVSWLLIKPAEITPRPALAQALPGAPWQPWAGQETRIWNFSTSTPGVDTVTQKCPVMYASAPLGRQTELDIARLQGLFATLYWLNAGILPADCTTTGWDAVVGLQVGLPIRWHGVVGAMVLHKAEKTAALDPVYADLAWPTVTNPLDDEARLRLLLVQFSPTQRAAFIQKHGQLPIVRQIELLAEELVHEEAMP
jgi:hypothetical protein